MIRASRVLVVVLLVSVVGVVAPQRAEAEDVPAVPPLVLAVGGATHYGDPSGLSLQAPLVGIAPTASGEGYWLTAADGGVFAYGDAPWLGSIPQVLPAGVRLAEPIVDAVPTSGTGYWLIASDGGVFAYGDAPWFGSIPQILGPGVKLAAPIVAGAATPSNSGYWLLGADGGIFSFGDAEYFGSVPQLDPMAAADAVAVVPSASGDGYTIHDRDGTVSAFGDAVFETNPTSPVADASRTATGEVSVTVGGRLDGIVTPDTEPGSGIAAVAISPGGGAWIVRNDVGPTVAVWQSGGLTSTSEAAATAAANRAGARSVISHGGSVDYVATWRSGVVVDAAPAGFRIAMSAIALDASAAPLLGGPAARALERGELAIGQRAAARHGIRRGDVVELFGWNNRTVRLTVGHIGESVEIGNIEMAMSPSTASQLGFDRPSAVIMWAFDEAALEAELALLPSSERWLTVNRSWVPSGRDSVLSTTVLKDLAGEPAYLPGGRGDAVTFQPGWTAENIAPVNVAILGTIRCNRVIADQLIAAFAEIEATGLGGLIDVADTRSNGGCFVPRTIRGPSGGNLSRHSWGVAIDVNPRSNPFGSAPTMDMRIVDIFRSHGFAWGGTWVRPDGMHFEWTGEVRIEVRQAPCCPPHESDGAQGECH